MAHPPLIDSDLTLKQYVEGIISRSDKGMKLDFKSLEVSKPSLEIVRDKGNLVRNPVWGNADVVKGPGSDNAGIDPQA